MAKPNPNVPVASLKYPTDYKLEVLTLSAPGFSGDLDLIPYMLEISYFEDMFNNTISGTVVISDAVGILNFASVSGTEYLHLRFRKSDDLPVTIDRVFRVYSISDRKFDPSNNNEMYKIEFCSEEYILSEQYRVCKSYKGQKISDIVTDICNNVMGIGKSSSVKQLFVDDTIGQQDFVISNKKPIETINWLANYAIPAKYPNGADMMFFENREGYFFTSLQHMYQTPATLSFVYNPKNVKSDVFQKMTNVLRFEVVNYIDTLDAMSKGTFSNRVISVDPFRRKKTTTDFSYNNYYKNSITLNGSPITNNYKNKLGKTMFDPPPKDLEAGSLRMVITNSNQQNGGNYTKNKPGTVSADYFQEVSVPNRVAQLSLATSTVIKITVPGNSGLFVGMCVEFNLSSPSPLNSKGNRPIDPYLSGRYLVTAVRHILAPASYICVAELSKDSGIMNYSGVNNNNAGWRAVTAGKQNNRN